MEQPKSSAISPHSSDAMDLVLPVPEEPIPRYHGMPIAWVFARNMQVMAETCYDEAYFGRSLARKVDVPFVMEKDYVAATPPGDQAESSSKTRRG